MPASLDRCPACHAGVAGTEVAAGVLTPPPAGGDALTFGAETSSASLFGQDPTGLPVGARVRGMARSDDRGSLAPGEAFGPRYHIIRLLGIGGMGAVYQACDTELNLAVALKIIRPDATADPAAERELERRFKQELLLARQVTHKNVVRIHDLGDIDGIKYITMPYIEGQDLATVLKEAGKLSVPAALGIARQIASGLLAAHDAGVVHGDLKPANIMVEQDRAVIMDFGIARSASSPHATPAAADGTSRMVSPSDVTIGARTVAGAVVGTLEYMAPEQAKAQPVDPCADIYAFGLILSDMLLGRSAATGAGSAIEEMRERIEHAPPPIRTVDPSIPEALEQIVSRAVQPDPAARYATTADLVADLERLDENGEPLPIIRTVGMPAVVASALLVLAMVVATWWYVRPRPVIQHEPMPVLIADFDNRTKDPVFDGSLEQALREAMEGASFVTVFPSANAHRLAAELLPSARGRVTPDAAKLISRREGIKVLLAGEIDRRAGGYRLAIRALDPANDKPIVTGEEDVAGRDEVLKAVARLAKKVRAALGETKTEMARLTAAETFTTSSFEAMNAYARGQDANYSGRYQDAIAAFGEALKYDPEFGRAYAMLGTVYFNLKQPERSKSYFDQALKRLDRMTEREKYRTLGGYYLGVVGNYPQGIETFETLVRLYPADNVGYNNLALGYLWSLNVQRAMEVSRKGIDIYPNNLMNRTNYAAYAVYAGQFDTAIAEASRVLAQNATYEQAFLPLALARVGRGDIDGARDAYHQLAKLSATGASLAAMGEADLEMYRGRYGEAIGILRAGIDADQKAGVRGEMARKYVALAEAQLALGRNAQAADAVNRAVALDTHESILFTSARLLIELGHHDRARKLASDLGNRLQSQTTAFARLIDADLAFSAKRPATAIDMVRDAQKRYDTWFAHYLLARIYSEEGHASAALEEFERCLKRRGETADVFFIDYPTLRYLPPLYYWAARAQQAAGASKAARENFERYISIRAGANPADPLVQDARQRLQAP